MPVDGIGADDVIQLGIGAFRRANDARQRDGIGALTSAGGLNRKNSQIAGANPRLLILTLTPNLKKDTIVLSLILTQSIFF